MTVNQIITLLEIYRGTESDTKDIVYLQNAGLIERAFLHGSKYVVSPEGDLWLTTEMGTRLIENIKMLSSDYVMANCDGRWPE